MSNKAHSRKHKNQALVNQKISESLSTKTPEKLRLLEEALTKGATVRLACVYAGVPERTYYDWLAADEQLSQRMDLVKNNNVFIALDTIGKAIKTDPAAAFKYVQHKVPEEWGNKIGIEHSGAVLLGVVDVPTQAAIDAYNKAKEEETLKAIDNEPEELHL